MPAMIHRDERKRFKERVLREIKPAILVAATQAAPGAERVEVTETGLIKVWYKERSGPIYFQYILKEVL
jgi:hypothetical protein